MRGFWTFFKEALSKLLANSNWKKKIAYIEKTRNNSYLLNIKNQESFKLVNYHFSILS